MDDATIDGGPLEAEGGAGAVPEAGAVAAGRVSEAPQTGLDDLALELGALAAGTAGVDRVQARPGAVEIARQGLGGLAAAVASVTGRAGAATGPTPAATPTPTGESAPAGRSHPLVTLVATDDETRVVLDLAVEETASGPDVARAVAARLLEHLVAHGLPDPTVDVRIVGVAS
jgi:hypothetical protein